MTLYDHPDCPYGMKVRIVLAEKEMDCDLITVDLQAGQHRQPEFLKLNPFGRVPVLIDEGFVVYESTIINEYIDDEYPSRRFGPSIPASGAVCAFWKTTRTRRSRCRPWPCRWSFPSRPEFVKNSGCGPLATWS